MICGVGCGRGGSGRWEFVDIWGRGAVVQEIESSDFGSPELRLASLLFSQSPRTCPHWQCYCKSIISGAFNGWRRRSSWTAHVTTSCWPATAFGRSHSNFRRSQNGQLYITLPKVMSLNYCWTKGTKTVAFWVKILHVTEKFKLSLSLKP